MKNSNKMKLVIGLVVLFAGLDLAILLSHLNRVFGIVLIIVGIGILFWAVEDKVPKEKKEIPDEEKNIVTRLIDTVTLNGRLKPLLPVAGIVILLLIIVYNIVLSDKTYFGSNDYVGLILASILLLYNYIPSKYSTERDFALLFSILLFVFLVIPTTILSLTSEEADTNSPLTYYLLSAPTVGLVNLFGIDAVTPGHPPIGPAEAYNYIDLIGPDGNLIALHISLSCSGLYSVAIFTSAFIAFVAVDYKVFDRRVLGFLGLGIILAWLANVLRMAIIVAVGHYYGWELMEWTHNNIGEVIFMLWVSIFWLIMFKYLHGPEKKKKDEKKESAECPICGEGLSPVLSSTRCDCGTIIHTGCLENNDFKCPVCEKNINHDSS